MTRAKKLTATLTLTALTLFGSLSLAQPAPAGPAPTRLAAINIIKTFNALHEKEASDKEIETMGKQINDERKKKEKIVESLREGLKMVDAKSNDYKRQQDEILQAAIDLQVFMSVSEQRVLIATRLKTEALYKKMMDAIERHCKANGIAMVFVIDDADLSTARSNDEMKARITMRKLVYAHPSYDITHAITTSMNTEYKP
jgi:Skp family chaperone for outer membrane proteins